MDKWYKTTYRRNLVDMHISEWDEKFLTEFDAEKYVANLKKADVEVAYIYTNNCLGISLYPSKVNHSHANLHGRDIVAEVIAECKKNGIMPVIYCNFWSRNMFEEHPDWRTVTPDGQTSLTWFKPQYRYGVCCMNSPFQSHMESMIEEIVKRYDTEAIWIDMSGAFSLCACDHCKERFKRETGYDYPDKIEWGGKEWTAFVKRRYDWIAESMERLAATAKRVKPGITVVQNSARYVQNHVRGLSEKYYKTTEFVSGDYNSGRLYNSFFGKLFYLLSENKPAEYLFPVMLDLTKHTIMRTENEILTQMYSAMANNVRFGFIDAINPIGTLNDAVYDRMKNVYAEHKKFEKYLKAETTAVADVGLYASLDCPVDEDENGMKVYSRIYDTRHVENTREFAVTLKKEGIPYKVITKKNISELETVKVLLLSDVCTMDKEEVSAIEKFVKDGGCVYASGEIADYAAEDYKKVEGGMLEDVLGVRMKEREKGDCYYVRPTAEGKKYFGYFGEDMPLAANAVNDKGDVLGNYIVEPKKGAVVLGKITYPYRNEKDPKAYSSAISNPPWEKSDKVAITENVYGAGKAIYSSIPIERLKAKAQREVIKNLLNSLIGDDPTISYSAPDCVEITLLRQTDGTLIINVLNDPVEEENLPVYGIKVSVKCDKPKEVVDAETGKRADWNYKDGKLNVNVEKVVNFKMFAVKK